ncbi:MAG TPA: phage tail assembly chaperone [Azospirillaceae bacterium]|nr:phage tail assembly chaperone [Azospirillaceae bacterium]
MPQDDESYCIYNVVTGDIEKIITCASHDLQINIGDNQSYVALVPGTGFRTHYVEAGVIRERAKPLVTWLDIRVHRSGLFAKYDGIVRRHRDQVELGIPTALTAQRFADVLQYLQVLRDIPQTFADPNAVIWPAEPL